MIITAQRNQNLIQTDHIEAVMINVIQIEQKMNYRKERPNKAKIATLSFLSGIGIAILSLFLGTILDYVIVQTLSQFILSDCSEDCYFDLFNSVFYVVVLLSLMAGTLGGIKTYRRFTERSS